MGGVLGGLIAALTKRYYLIAADNNGSVKSYQINKGLTGTVNSLSVMSRTSFYGVALSPNKKSVVATGIQATGTNNLLTQSWNNLAGTFTSGMSGSTSFGTANNTSTGRVAFNPAGNTVAAYSAGGATPYVWAYPFSDSTGFGTKYANPASLPTSGGTSPGLPTGITFNPSGSVIAMGGVDSPFIHAYPWSSGFGTKYASTAGLADATLSVKFNPAGDVVVVAGAYGGTSRPNAYVWSSGFGTRYASAATSIVLPVTDAVWNSAGTAVLFSAINTSATAVYAYPWSSGWGTRYAVPATTATNGNTITLAENETSVYVGLTASPYIVGYDWSTSSGFGTKFANPASGLSAKVTSITSNG